MKHLILFNFIFIGLSSFSQETTSTLSKTLIKKNTSFKKDINLIYSTDDGGKSDRIDGASAQSKTSYLKICEFKLTDLGSGVITKGYLFQSEVNNEIFAGYLDLDEVPNFIKHLNTIISLNESVPSSIAEYFYNSKELKLNSVIGANRYWSFTLNYLNTLKKNEFQLKAIDVQKLKEAIANSFLKFK
jgi:hypothetical protein